MATLDPAAIGSASFSGRNGAGAITITGTEVGDLVTATYETDTGNVAWIEPGSVFEPIVTVAGELQQLNGGDLTSATYAAVFVRPT
jgi:hypothetical protein